MLPWGNNDDPLAGNSTAPPVDMTVPVPLTSPDLAFPSGLGGAGQLGCRGYAACYGACNNNSATDAQFTQCAAACDAAASSVAVQALNATFNCGISACVSAARCAGANDSSANCLLCAYDAISAIFQLSCAGDPVCNVAACSAQMNACESSTP
jgi:hypothetical protein